MKQEEGWRELGEWLDLLYEPKEAAEFLGLPQQLLDCKKPIDLVLGGKIGAVIACLELIAEGNYG